MCQVHQGVNPSLRNPGRSKMAQAKKKDISGLTHGVGWCAPQQGTCKLTLNVKGWCNPEATIGCSGYDYSAAMASEDFTRKNHFEALNTDLVCDAINTAMRELFLQIVYEESECIRRRDFLSVQVWKICDFVLRLVLWYTVLTSLSGNDRRLRYWHCFKRR